MKKIITLILCSFSFSIFASPNPNYLKHCEQALPTTSPDFCTSFKAIAQCQCESRLPGPACHNMNRIYSIMIGTYGSLDRACSIQVGQPDGTDKQTCLDDWNCYRNGGKDSHGGLCSSTGNSCP